MKNVFTVSNVNEMFSVDGNCSLIFQSCVWTMIVNRCNRYLCGGATGKTPWVHQHSWTSSRNVSTFLTPSAYVPHLIWDYFCFTQGWFHWSKGKNWRTKIAPLKSIFCQITTEGNYWRRLLFLCCHRFWCHQNLKRFTFEWAYYVKCNVCTFDANSCHLCAPLSVSERVWFPWVLKCHNTCWR